MEEQSIELREYFQILRKRFWIIVLIFLQLKDPQE